MNWDPNRAIVFSQPFDIVAHQAQEVSQLIKSINELKR